MRRFIVSTLLLFCTFSHNLVFSAGSSQSDAFLQTGSATDITGTSAVLSGKLLNPGAQGKIGILYSNRNDPDTKQWRTAAATEMGWDNSFTVTVGPLAPETTYYYKAYILNNCIYRCSEVKSFRTAKAEYPACKAVDMGLSVKWASTNLGSSKEEGIDMFFSWGDTSPKASYDAGNYNWNNNPKIYLYSCDPAYTHLSANWRMPTSREWKELQDNCDWIWGTRNGVQGFTIRSRRTGNTIFLPVLRPSNRPIHFPNTSNEYWSSSRGEKDKQAAFAMTSSQTGKASLMERNRSRGLLIRPVYDARMGVKVFEATNIGVTSATITGSIPGAAPHTDVHFYYSTNASDVQQQLTGASTNPDGTFSVTLNRLKGGTKYWYKAYVKNSEYAWPSNVGSFTTLPPTITLNSVSVSNSRIGSCRLNASVSADMGIGNEDVLFLLAKGVHSLDSLKVRGEEYFAQGNPQRGSDNISLVFHSDIYSLEIGQVYSYVVKIKIPSGDFYGEVQSFESSTRLPSPQAVDLGLSVKWASFNLGASAANQPGKVYFWGKEKEPRVHYSFDLIRYIDVVSDALGSNWRTPSRSEIQELEEQCTWTWTTVDGVSGYEVTSKINGNSIFLPSSGANTFYWSSTPSEDVYKYEDGRGDWYPAKGCSYGLSFSKRKKSIDKRKIKKACLVRAVTENK